MNISTILDMAADCYGERVACSDEAGDLSYAALRSGALRVAQSLREKNLEHCVLLDVAGRIAPMALFGAAYAGIPYVPINYRLTAKEIGALLARVTPACVVYGEAYGDLVTGREGLHAVSRSALLEIASADTEPPEPSPAEPEEIAVQLFTSGTTGEPKAAILRHENLMSYILGTVEFASAEEHESTLVTVPPYHIAGISALMSSTYAGRKIVFLPNFDPARWIELIQQHSVTNAFVVPTMLQRIMEHCADKGGLKLPSLRALAYGGGKMPLATIEQAMSMLPDVAFTNAYGLTETSSTIAVLGPEDHRAAASSEDPKVRRRLSSVGQATGAVEIQIRAEDGQALGADETGDVYVRGPQVAGEYKSLGSRLEADGWFPTRDRGFLDDQAYLFLDGRADDVIVRGGENISPGEIEDVLIAHPAVSDVAVVAIPDAEWGEGVAAAVVLHDGQSVEITELQERVRQQLRSSRVPQQIRFLAGLPYNETGKVLRRVIRDELSQDSS